LKKRFLKELVSAAPDLDFLKMRMKVDASNYVIKGVLSIEYEYG